MKRLFQPIEFVLSVTALVMACAVLVVIGFATGNPPSEHGNCYPSAGIVTEVDREAGLVTVRTSVGIEYAFYGDDYEPGDFCALLMDDMGTESDILDDAVSDVRYAGIIEDFR